MDLKLDRVKKLVNSNSYIITLDLDDRLFVLMVRDADKRIQGEALSMIHEGQTLTLPITKNVTNEITISGVEMEVHEIIEKVRKTFVYENELPAAYFMEMMKGFTGQLSSMADKTRRIIAKRILSHIAKDLTDERRELYLGSVCSASNAISTELTELHNDLGYVLGKIEVEKGKGKVIRQIYNLLTTGLRPHHLNRKLDTLYERLLGWQLLNECINPYADILEADAQVLQIHGDGELAKQFKILSSFYRQLDTQAGYAERRMSNLVKDYVKAWSLLGLVRERDDFTSIKDKLVERVSNP